MCQPAARKVPLSYLPIYHIGPSIISALDHTGPSIISVPLSYRHRPLCHIGPSVISAPLSYRPLCHIGSVHRAWMVNLVVPCRSGLSGFSSTISMDNIELPRHTRVVGKQRRAAVKALGQAAERASSWQWLKKEQ